MNRDPILQQARDVIHSHQQASHHISLQFICTHNSRRSQAAQAIAATIADELGLNYRMYSGGTEVTAFHPNMVAALQRAGMDIRTDDPTHANPKYQLHLKHSQQTMPMWSKRFDDPHHASEPFIAVMTCDHADVNCPYIPGAAARISLPFVDPKRADGTDAVDTVYDECVAIIQTELKFILQP